MVTATCNSKIFPIDFQLRTAGCKPLQSTSVEGHIFQDVSKSKTRSHMVGIPAITAKPEPCDRRDIQRCLVAACFVSQV